MTKLTFSSRSCRTARERETEKEQEFAFNLCTY
jgi:hypothetical protein